MLENCDKIMHLRFNFDVCSMHSPFGVFAPDTSKSQYTCIILSQCTRKSKYAVINLKYQNLGQQMHLNTCHMTKNAFQKAWTTEPCKNSPLLNYMWQTGSKTTETKMHGG